jgi:predicted PolB exonuclease-like 3'-5' exonuclease
LRSLDSPQYRPREMVQQFWEGLGNPKYKFKLISFNRRGFDIPVLELAAFRYSIPLPPQYFAAKYGYRNRYAEEHCDMLELLTNYGAIRLTGGLDLLAKLLGKPGKMGTKGSDVYALYREGKLQEINDYCCYDVLDTYFVFLRTRVLFGEITPEQELLLIEEAKKWLVHQSQEQAHLKKYLDHWTDEHPWP